MTMSPFNLKNFTFECIVTDQGGFILTMTSAGDQRRHAFDQQYDCPEEMLEDLFLEGKFMMETLHKERKCKP